MKLQKKILVLLCATLSFVGCSTPESPLEGSLAGIQGESNKIYYTSLGNVVVTPNSTASWGVTITDNTNIEGVGCISFSGNVTALPNSAFENCTTLTSVLLPTSLQEIGDRAFMNCQSLTEIAIPDSVTSIGASAFTGCVELQRVVLGKGLRTIGDNAFAACNSLLELRLPEGLEQIGRDAIPTHVIYNVPDDFVLTYRTTDSKKIEISEYSTWSESLGADYIISHEYKNGWGTIVFNKRITQACFNYVENYDGYGDRLTEVIIPESVTSFPSCAFYDCYYLEKINFPAGLTEIGYAAFRYCRSLTEVILPKEVKKVDSYAFCDCYELSSLTIENGVEVIEEHAFEGCTKLGTVIIPESMNEIGQYAFSRDVLESLVVPDKFYLHYTATSQIHIDYSYSGTGSASYLIRHNFVDGKGDVCFNAPITRLGYHFFSGISALTGVTIPESVTSIIERAIYNCPNITEITIPEGVTSISRWAFEKCTSLSKVTLISPVPPTAGEEIFKDTSSDLKIYVPKGSEEAYRTAPGWSTYSDRITSK